MVCKCDQLPHLCCKSEVANSIDVHSQYQLETKRKIHLNPLCGAEVGHMVCSSLGTNKPMKTAPRLQSCQLIQSRVKQLQVSHSDPEDSLICTDPLCHHWSQRTQWKQEWGAAHTAEWTHTHWHLCVCVCDLHPLLFVFLSLLQAVKVKTGILTPFKAQLTFIRTSQRRRSNYKHTMIHTQTHISLINCS